MKKLFNFYNKIEEYLLVYSLVFNVILVFSQVIMRSIFNLSLSWSEELSRYIFIWQIWLGTSIAIKEDKHINVELIYQIVKSKKAKKIISIVGMLIWLGFSVFLVQSGTELAISMFKRNAISSGMRIPLYLIYVSLPISSLAVIFRLIGRLYNSVKDLAIDEGGGS